MPQVTRIADDDPRSYHRAEYLNAVASCQALSSIPATARHMQVTVDAVRGVGQARDGIVEDPPPIAQAAAAAAILARLITQAAQPRSAAGPAAPDPAPVGAAEREVSGGESSEGNGGASAPSGAVSTAASPPSSRSNVTVSPSCFSTTR